MFFKHLFIFALAIPFIAAQQCGCCDASSGGSSTGLGISGYIEAGQNAIDQVKSIIHEYNLARHLAKSWYATTGDGRCNRYAQGRQDVEGWCTFLINAFPWVPCDPDKDPRCNRYHDDEQKAKIIRTVGRLISLADNVRKNPGQLVYAQRQAENAMELIQEIENETSRWLSHLEELFACIHSYSTEIVEDNLKTDNNQLLKKYYNKLLEQLSNVIQSDCEVDCLRRVWNICRGTVRSKHYD